MNTHVIIPTTTKDCHKRDTKNSFKISSPKYKEKANISNVTNKIALPQILTLFMLNTYNFERDGRYKSLSSRNHQLNPGASRG